jgi:hypothetical protein
MDFGMDLPESTPEMCLSPIVPLSVCSIAICYDKFASPTERKAGLDIWTHAPMRLCSKFSLT